MTTKTTSDVTLPVALAAAIPLLLWRLGLVYVRMKAKRRGGVRAFRGAVLRAGMDRTFADQLAAEYESYGRLRSYIGDGGALRFLPRL